jgi:hypothetical protein
MGIAGPVMRTTRLTNTVRNIAKGFSQIQGDTGLAVADSPEDILHIIGTGGITTEVLSSEPDTLVINGSGLASTSYVDERTTWCEDEFVPTLNQITFTLSHSPKFPTSVFFIINGVVYDDSLDYVVNGLTITWTNNSFHITASDTVIIRYI